MRFVLIRHAQSTNNLLYERTGGSAGRHHDPALTELGHQQADLLARHIADGVLPWSITHLYTSLMQRAVQTAAPLADALDLPLLGHVDAYETGGPFIEDDGGLRTPHPGGNLAELSGLSGRLVPPATLTEAGWFPGPFEENDAVMERAYRLIADLRSRHAEHESETTVAVVMHGAFFQYLLRALLGAESMTGWVVKHNTAISLFADEPLTDQQSVTAHKIDWTPHLTQDLETL